VTSYALHVIAMLLMLGDHLWATIFPYMEWLTCIGRIAFPLFAFLITEGYVHTRNFKKYLLRLFVFAIISEIPFDFLYGSTWFYPFHQNVLWTFLLALLFMKGMDKIREKFGFMLSSLLCAILTLLAYIVGTVTMVDYYGVGVLTVLLFYFTKKDTPLNLFLQFLGMYFLHVTMLGGYYYDVELFGIHFEIVQQGLAVLALPLIWLYKGEQGYHEKWFQYFCYAFYPLHLILLYIIWQLAI